MGEAVNTPIWVVMKAAPIVVIRHVLRYNPRMCFLSVMLAALLPTAFVKEIPETVRNEELITIAEARTRLIANHGERIFFRTKGTIIANKHGKTIDFILLDKTAATSAICSCDDPWQVGDEISVICTAMQPEYENPTLISEALEIKVLQHQTPVMPSFIHPVDLVGHRNDFNLVKIEGVVIDAFRDDVNPQWSILVLAQDDVQTMVWAHSEDLGKTRPLDLVDSLMQITGIVLPDLSNFYRARGPWVLASSQDALQVIRPPPSDPFKGDAAVPHRQVLTGKVIACWGDDSFFLATDDGKRIRVRMVGSSKLPCPGDVVRVAGFLRHNEFCVRLSNALIKIEKHASAEVEAPLDCVAPGIFTGTAGENQGGMKLNGRTIRLTGVVREQHALGTSASSLTLSAGSALFNIWIGKATPVPAVGSRIEVTGACILDDNVDMETGIVRVGGFSVALRSSADLRVLAEPPWWTPARLFLLIIILILLLVAVFVWNSFLRAIVAKRSRELARETIRSTSANLRLEERKRLAVELHDTIAQNLTGVSFEIKTITRLADTSLEKMKEHLAIVDRMLKSCRDDIRNCIWDLRANSLDQRSLDQAITLALDPHIGNVALKVNFNVSRSRISEPALHVLIRIVRELAINAIRHGNATEMMVVGGIEDNKLVCSVSDNGCGFDPQSVPGVTQGHFGLQGVRERVRSLGGSLTIESSPGRGTRVVVRLNLLCALEDSLP